MHKLVPPPMRAEVSIGTDLQEANKRPRYPHEGTMNVVDRVVYFKNLSWTCAVRIYPLIELHKVIFVVDHCWTAAIPSTDKLLLIVKWDNIRVTNATVNRPRGFEFNKAVVLLFECCRVARLHWCLILWCSFFFTIVGCRRAFICTIGREDDHLCIGHRTTPAPASVGTVRQGHVHHDLLGR